MKKTWNIEPRPKREEVEHLSRLTGLSFVTSSLLIQRGVRTPEDVELFLHPSLNQLHDPYLMLDMDKAVARIRRAIDSGEKILVYGDYDVDGTTAVALVYKALRHIEGDDARLGFYIPDRFNEGYGISRQGVEFACDGGYSLTIALDCGIKAVDMMREAKASGLDFIICDHHVAGDQIPDVVACLDPKRPGCPYPDKNLSGCGVGYKLMEALYMSLGLDLGLLTQYLDMLVVSIASDIVPMVGENRVFARFGIERLNSRPSVGLKSIMDVSGVVTGHATVADIVFKIGPRINAAGRMKSGGDAVRLLISTDKAEADAISRAIDDSNDERKDLDREITREAMDMIDSSDEMRDANSIVLYRPAWNKGVIGIVASRLSEAFLRPAVILTRSKTDPDMATGSARSVEGFDLYRAIESCSEVIEDFGGHTYAAGLTLKVANVQAFRRKFGRYVDANMPLEAPKHQIDVDLEIRLADINRSLVAELELMEPFGPGNRRPVFVTRDVYDYSTSKVFGHARQHLKLDMIESDGRAVRSGVGFGLGDLYRMIDGDKSFDVCFTVDRNIYRGRSVVQLMIKDLHTQ